VTAQTHRRGLSRAVAWCGIAIGTALAVLAMTDGARLHIGGHGLPGWIRAAVGAVVLWLVTVAAVTVVAELARRHHKTVGRAAWRQARRGGSAAARGARTHGGRLAAAAGAWAEPRWQRRTAGDSDGSGRAFAAPSLAERIRAWRHGRRLFSRRPGPGATSPADDAPAPRRVCSACGGPEGGERGPLVTWWNGPDAHLIRRDGPEAYMVHRSHFEDPRNGLYGQPYEEAPAGPGGTTTTENGGTTMSEPTTPPAVPRLGRRSRARRTDGAGAGWKQLAADTADFEPEDDADLLSWMAGEVTGMTLYAESITEVYETGVNTVGLDPVSLAALHEYAEAAAEASEAMAHARAKFAAHYSEVREFAAAGGLLPYNGRWMTGEGDS
jgi:hypothetical protein